MNRLTTLAAVISATMLLSSAARAMDLVKFDQMNLDDQAEYVADVIQGAEKVLNDAGQKADATTLHHLFADIAPGDRVSLGMAEFNVSLAEAHVDDSRRIAANPNARRLEVEDAFFMTMKHRGIVLPQAFFTVSANFRSKLPPKQ